MQASRLFNQKNVGIKLLPSHIPVACTLTYATPNSMENVPAVMWEEAYLCSIMRSHQPVPSLPGIKMIPAHPMMNDQVLVTLATKYFWEGKKLQF
jgi:hypothetical protein